MSAAKNLTKALPLAHAQQRFIEKFVSGEFNDHFIELRMPTGSGKTRVAAEIISQLARKKRDLRILAITSFSPGLILLLEGLKLSGTRASMVDRYRFRALQDEKLNSTSVWERGTSYLLHSSFAARDDILASLCSVNWDFIFLLGADDFANGKHKELEQIILTSPGARVLYAPFNQQFSVEESPRIDWRIVEIPLANLTKKATDANPSSLPSSVEVIIVQYSHAELSLISDIIEIAEALIADSLDNSQFVADLLARLKSSPIALEEIVRRVRNFSMHAIPLSVSTHSLNERQENSLSIDTKNHFYPWANCLLQIENLAVDSKIECLKRLVEIKFNEFENSSHMYVNSEFSSTTIYLRTALEEIGRESYLLLETMTPSEQYNIVQDFYKTGGILLGSSKATFVEVDFKFVNCLVMYDLPSKKETLGRFYWQFFHENYRSPKRKTFAFSMPEHIEKIVGELSISATELLERLSLGS